MTNAITDFDLIKSYIDCAYIIIELANTILDSKSHSNI